MATEVSSGIIFVCLFVLFARFWIWSDKEPDFISRASLPTGSTSHGGDVAVYMFGIKQPSFSAPYYSVLVSVSVYTALSTVFYFINSPDNSPLSHSVLPVLFLPFWSFQLYLFMKVSFSPDIILCCWLGLKHQIRNKSPPPPPLSHRLLLASLYCCLCS